MSEENGTMQPQAAEPQAGKRNFFRRKKLLLGVLGGLTVLLCGAAVFVFADRPVGEAEAASLMQTGVFYENVHINGVDVGGLTVAEAREKVEAAPNGSPETFALDLTLDGEKWRLTGADLKLTSDIEDVLKEAMLYEKSGSWFNRVTAQNKLENEGHDFTVTLTPDSKALQDEAERIAAEATVQPVEPKLNVTGTGEFTVTDGKNGHTVDPKTLLTTLQTRFDGQDFSDVKLESKVTRPEATAEEVRANTVLMATFTTHYKGSANRRYNVEKAAGIINNTMVKPGEIYDINEVLGPRTYAGGWRGANGIVGGTHYEIEPGGGVCQVSTTLFGAVLRADLEVVERHNHTFPSDYVKIGQDATISTGGPNFRFKNTRSWPVYVIARIDKKKSNITVELYGPPHPKGYTVEITSELISTTYPGPAVYTVDNSKPVGYKEEVSLYHVGKKSKTYKTYYKNGKQVGDRIQIYADTYPPVRARYIIGGKKVSTPKPAKSTQTPASTPAQGSPSASATTPPEP